VRIGLIGWYGHGNAGDERILYCLRRFFEGHDILVTRDFDDASTRIADLNSCDFVILGGGGLILRDTGRYADLLEHLTPRFGCAGISIEARHADNLRIIETIKERSEFILVRDSRSRELLDCHFKTIVGPDLTFLYPFEVTAPSDEEICGLNIRPWPFWQGEHQGAFDRLMRRLDHTFGDLSHLYPLAKWEPGKAIDILQQRFKVTVPLPLYFEQGVANDRSVLTAYFTDVPDLFTESQFQRCRYIVAMRLHALIFACQMGIPFLSLSYQPKNGEFCRSLGMPELSLDIFDAAQLAGAIDELKSGRDRVRSRLISMRDSCHQEITTIMMALRDLITQSAQRGCRSC
jgi:polysaccharide pyruvyl transferase WcaK-like protein